MIDEKGNQIPSTPNGICIVGEAWGEQELLARRPFVGYAGHLLTTLLRQAGINREDCFITNLINDRPEKNNFDAFPRSRIERGVQELFDFLDQHHDDINVLVLLGNNPLKWVVGEDGILSWRGSILKAKNGMKAIPTLHPAFLLRGNTMANPIVVADLRKAKRESSTPKIEYPKLDLKVVKDPTEAVYLLNRLTDYDGVVACDIETPFKGKKLLKAYGIATSPTEAFSITQEVLKLPKVLRALGRFSRSTTKKVFHNANFDVFNLAFYYGIATLNIDDTMVMQHICYPYLPSFLKPKSLAFCNSLYGDLPYWKEEMTDDIYIYNAKDCVVTYRIYGRLKDELRQWQVENVYAHDIKLLYPLMSMELVGLRVDLDSVKEMRTYNERIIENLEKILRGVVGDVNVQSPKQLKELLYDRLKYPVVKDKGKITTDVKALNRLESIPSPFQPIIGLIKLLRKHYVMRGFYNLNLDHDGRMRAEFKLAGTITGRLASSKRGDTNIGRNIQNIPKPMRRPYIPDDGMIFVNADLSQAEARVVAALCGDEDWVREFEREDTYKKVASYLFDKPKEEITKSERQIAKKVTHAANYNESWKGLSEVLQVPAQRAKYLMKKIYELRPKLDLWHKHIEETIKRDRMIRADNGRILQFFGKVSDKDIRTAMAFIPQTIVVQYINDVIQNIYDHIPEAILLVQVHDSILFEVPDDKDLVRRVIEKVKTLGEKPIIVNGIKFVIPLDFGIGMNWRDIVEMKTLNDFDSVWEVVHDRRT